MMLLGNTLGTEEGGGDESSGDDLERAEPAGGSLGAAPVSNMVESKGEQGIRSSQEDTFNQISDLISSFPMQYVPYVRPKVLSASAQMAL